MLTFRPSPKAKTTGSVFKPSSTDPTHKERIAEFSTEKFTGFLHSEGFRDVGRAHGRPYDHIDPDISGMNQILKETDTHKVDCVVKS